MAEGGPARGLQRLSDVLGAALAALLAFTAVPAVLVVVVGDPLAGGLGHASPLLTREGARRPDGGGVAGLGRVLCAAPARRRRARAARPCRCGLRRVGPRPRGRAHCRGRVGPDDAGRPVGRLVGCRRSGCRSPDRHLRLSRRQRQRIRQRVTLARVHIELRRATGRHLVVDRRCPPGRRCGLDVDRRPQPRPRRGQRRRASSTPTTSGPAGTCACPARANAARRLDASRSASCPRICPSWWRSAWARSPAPHWPAAPGAGAAWSISWTTSARSTLLSERAIDTAALLDRFHGVPALAAFEKANCLLGAVVHERVGARPPVVRAICVGPSGVTFWLAQPEPDAPDGFAPVAGGAAWLVEHSRLVHVDVFYPFVPVALPVGDDDEGTWLVTLGPGDVLPVLGESAPALCRAARSALESWTWSDIVTVADDPADPRLADRAAPDPMTSDPCVFFGQPRRPHGGADGPCRGRHDGRGGGHRPHAAGGSPGRHPPPDGPGRPPPARFGAHGPGPRRADGSPGRAGAPARGRRHHRRTAPATHYAARTPLAPSTSAC